MIDPKNISKTNTNFSIFNDNHDGFVNEVKFYTSSFGYVPNIINDHRISAKEGIKWFTEKYAEHIKEHVFKKCYFEDSKQIEFEKAIFMLYEDLMVSFNRDYYNNVVFLFRKTPEDKINQLLEDLQQNATNKVKENRINIVHSTYGGLELKALKINPPQLNIEDNYNNDFLPVHQHILSRLSKEDDKGILLLHGKPGAGKTSYIRYLISVLSKRVIFLPPNMAAKITNPDLINVLLDTPNSVFVVEDAENIIVDRDVHGGSPVAAILNISDGLLSDCLNTQIICSFNTDISRIDEALLRKGRLIARYEFKELDVEKAQLLSDKLGFKSKFTKPTLLTDIYNQEEPDTNNHKVTKSIGFKI